MHKVKNRKEAFYFGLIDKQNIFFFPGTAISLKLQYAIK